MQWSPTAAFDSVAVVEFLPCGTRKKALIHAFLRQVWVEGPASTKLKYDWLQKGGYKGFGIWVAGAVGAVEQYWWGGGCDGNTSQKVCPQNMTLTEQFAREMWAPVPSRAAWSYPGY